MDTACDKKAYTKTPEETSNKVMHDIPEYCKEKSGEVFMI